MHVISKQDFEEVNAPANQPFTLCLCWTVTRHVASLLPVGANADASHAVTTGQITRFREIAVLGISFR